MELSGSLVAIVTPMEADGEIDWLAWDALIDWHCEQGSDGIVVVGTTGESPTVSLEEAVELVAKAVERVDGRVPIIAGAGTHATESTIERARVLADAGADALLVVTPYYNKPPQAGLIKHFLSVADAVSTPIVLYNVPGRTGVDLLPSSTATLAAHPRIVAIKEAVAGPARVREILDAAANFTVLSGDDPTFVAAMEAGAKGVISVSANVVPRAMHEIASLAQQGRWDEAKALDQALQELHQGMFVEPNPIPAKAALKLMGRIESGIRLPLVEASPAAEATVRAVLKTAGVL